MLIVLFLKIVRLLIYIADASSSTCKYVYDNDKLYWLVGFISRSRSSWHINKYKRHQCTKYENGGLGEKSLPLWTKNVKLCIFPYDSHRRIIVKFRRTVEHQQN